MTMTDRRPAWEDYAIAAAAAGLILYNLRQQRGRTSKALIDDDARSSALDRVAAPDRGRGAAAPWQIPWLGWKDILLRTWRQVQDDRLLAIAAGVVFYGLLALFPAVTALVSSYGLFADPSTISGNLQNLAAMLPAGSYAIVEDQIARVLSKETTTLGTAFFFGLAVAVWSANAGMKAIIDALNVVYGEQERRGFIRLNLISLAFTVGLLLSILLMLASIVVVPLTFDRFGLQDSTAVVIRYARWPALALILLSGLAILYRFGPSRAQARWQWLSVGALMAASVWIFGSSLLSWYLSAFAQYDATYGSLGTAIGLMTWMWMSAIIVLFGAELNSEIEHQTAIDTTTGPAAPRGLRGAIMADEIGKAVS